MNPVKPDPYQPCPCGSGLKYKFCCYAKGQALSKEHPLTLIKKSLDYPVVQCWINENWQQHGLANVFVIRQEPNLKLIIGVYLVDVLCLGVKDTFCNANLDASEVKKLLISSGMPIVEIDYEDARSLVLGAIAYARTLGIEPHEDWRNASYVVDPQRPFVPKFTFGSNGEPMYVQGPFDDADAIAKRLLAKK